ncbi:MAG: thioredoxin [Rhodospirillaceae bacterium]|nr:thioredoxin [Rhodospirillaceae bacterium]
MEPLIGMGQAEAAPAQYVKDSDTEHFVDDVIQASQTAPVIVDFWAPWCGPCKQLGPILEKAVNAARGAVTLIKINVDENQHLASQLQIRSIPAVMAFSQGRPVDGFVGALPESQIKEFVGRLAGPGAGGAEDEPGLDDAKAALDAGDTATAGSIYRHLLGQDPDNAAALAGVARCYIAEGNLDGARATLDAAPKAPVEHAEIAAARSALALAEESANAGDPEALARSVEANPDNHQARIDLAVALFAHHRAEEAVDQLLEAIRRDRDWNEQAARKQLVKLFEVMGPTAPATVKGRRRLSSVLFS